MKLHIVCTANTFRSRMAEAYINSKKIKGLKVSSSGIKAKDNHTGPITWFGMKILKEKNLVPFMSKYWTQTTSKIIDNADFIIFMEHIHLNWCKEHLGYDKENFVVLNVADLYPNKERGVVGDVMESEEIYEEIKYKLDKILVLHTGPSNNIKIKKD